MKVCVKACFLVRFTAIILSCFNIVYPGDVTVVKFQEDGLSGNQSFLRFKEQIQTTEKFSVCFRLKIYQELYLSSILSYSVEDFNNELYIGIDMKQQSLEILCCLNRFSSSSPIDIPLYVWFSICASIDLRDKLYVFVQNGKAKNITDANSPKDSNETDVYVRGMGKAYLGQNQDSSDGKFNPFRSFRGDIAEFHFINDSLTEEEMIDFTSCNGTIDKPSVMNFKNVENNFEVQHVLVVPSSEDFCDQVNTFYTIFDKSATFSEAAQFCQVIGGKVAYPMNPFQNELLFILTSNSSVCSKNNVHNGDVIWLALVTDEGNQTWQNYHTGEHVHYTNFNPMEQKPPEKFRCVSHYSCASGSESLHTKWLMRDCTEKRKIVCEFDKIQILHLRGLTRNPHLDEIDRRYIISPNSQGNVVKGNGYSEMVHDPESDHWVIKRKDIPHMKLEFSGLLKFYYPVGKKTWTVSSADDDAKEMELKLSVCSDGEFSCNDGFCVNLSHRCDLRLDCDDGSDEEDCSPLILPPKYSVEIPPPTERYKQVNEISLLFYILNVLSVKVETFHISMELYLKSSWIDPRLRYKNLKNITYKNMVKDLHETVWVPNFFFVGPFNASCTIVKRKSTFSIEQLSEPLPDNDENISEDLIFEGSKNLLTWEQKYTLSTYCKFDLGNFPFDNQICELHMGLEDLPPENFHLHLEGNGIELLGPRRLAEYEIENISIFSDQEQGQVTLTLRFRNLVMYYVSSTFTPTFMVLIVGYLPFYFPIMDFNDRIMVAVTALLVQSSYFTQMYHSIPKTVYLKMIDIWCIFCILVLFAITVALTIINYSWKLMRKGTSTISPIRAKQPTPSLSAANTRLQQSPSPLIFSKRLNLFSKIFFLICSFTFMIWYTISAVTLYWD